MPLHPLHDLRQQINALDDAVLALLGKRYALLAEVVNVKVANGLPSPDPARVAEVIDRNVLTGALHGLPEDMVRRIWEAIIDAAHDYEIPRMEALQKK